MSINSALVVGASGKLGGLIVDALLKKNLQVTGLVRPQSVSKVQSLSKSPSSSSSSL